MDRKSWAGQLFIYGPNPTKMGQMIILKFFGPATLPLLWFTVSLVKVDPLWIFTILGFPPDNFFLLQRSMIFSKSDIIDLNNC